MKIFDAEWRDKTQSIADRIRCRVLEHTVNNNGGYLSQACSAGEIFAALYGGILNIGPSAAPAVPVPFAGVPGKDNSYYTTGGLYNGPHAAHLDRFILSPSQYALVLYAVLVEVGRMAPEGMQQFNKDGSTVEMIGAEHSPGMEMMTGSLGQGLSQAAGIAMARKLRGDTGKVWVFMSDGEFQSGQNWEAIQAMAFHKLDNMAVVVDVNGQQCDGPTPAVMSIEPLDKRLEAFGAKVCRIDGHDIDALVQAALIKEEGKPLVVLADTNPCRGLDILKARHPKLHYVRFADDKERNTYSEMLVNFKAIINGKGAGNCGNTL